MQEPVEFISLSESKEYLLGVSGHIVKVTRHIN